MNAFEVTLASCPWLPVIGNHESYLGPGHDKVNPGTEARYLNQTWGLRMARVLPVLILQLPLNAL